MRYSANKPEQFLLQAQGESEENLKYMELMDRYYLKNPYAGVLTMEDYLKDQGYKVNRKRIRRLLRKMGIEAVYPKKNLSKPGQSKYKHPYLLRNLQIERPNQVWAIDITYVPMRNGFMYLTAIIDVYSRFIVGWYFQYLIGTSLSCCLTNGYRNLWNA